MPRVLIVEDENPLRRIITLNLARRGYSVAEADSVASAEEALAAWDNAFDVILLDINLPDQTGWDVLRYLSETCSSPTAPNGHPRSGQARPPVIVVTAVRPAQSRIEEFRPAAVLLKPFPLQALFRLIERVLSATPAATEEEDDGEAEHPDAQSSVAAPPDEAVRAPPDP